MYLLKSDVDGFLTRLQKAVPNATLLRPLRIPDFHLESPEKARALEAFVERALWGNVTARLELQNLTHSPERRWRTHPTHQLRNA